MRPRLIFAFALLSCLAVSSFTVPTQDPADEHEDETPLAQSMHRLEDALRDLRRSVRDPEKNAKSLVSVLICEEATIACRREIPVMAATVPEAEREAFITEYYLEMIGLQRALIELELALRQGQDVETVRALYKGIKGLEDPAHERFTEDG
jgi:Tfp pilus assembly protein FimV